MRPLIALICLLIVSNNAQAQSYQITGTPTYAGTGCPNGSAAIAVTPDGQSISFLFDQFSGTVAPMGRAFGLRMSCRIIVPITITRGYSLDTTIIYYNGFANVPDKTSMRLETSGLSVQRMAPAFATVSSISGPFQNNFSFEQKVVNGIGKNPKCPKDPNLNLTIQVELAGRAKDLSFTLDSADVGGAGLVVGVALKPCKL